MGKVISGRNLSLIKKDKLKFDVEKAKKLYGREPHLVVILVGDNPSSLSYISGKTQGCEYVGIKNTTTVLSRDTTTEALLSYINELNYDDSVDGILVQLPLPKHIDSDVVLDAISVYKDVDGFHPVNFGLLFQKRKTVVPCTAQGIMDILDYADVEIEGKVVCVIGRSNIVGLPVAKLLLDRNATVITAHSRTKNLTDVAASADILIVAIGKPRFITANMVKDGACVIDVGVNRDSNNKLCGDVDFDSVKDKTAVITKVPGGVGPMTIACLLENTYKLYLNNFNK